MTVIEHDFADSVRTYIRTIRMFLKQDLNTGRHGTI